MIKWAKSNHKFFLIIEAETPFAEPRNVGQKGRRKTPAQILVGRFQKDRKIGRVSLSSLELAKKLLLKGTQAPASAGA
jgi:hypothetical protein